ncbi:hypothetical protein ACU8KH_04424 [Lachancea thermotolerans]
MANETSKSKLNLVICCTLYTLRETRCQITDYLFQMLGNSAQPFDEFKLLWLQYF